ncbi:glycosyltransferase [Corynebacterium ulceribovis]|uniref:glycosyltransferase n=1 Tax=Corynebacterium ulceribovis TaxID=487732 RepID=UPI000476FEDA|nr:glycosyltransferase [Corynebacterium ulceribovis]
MTTATSLTALVTVYHRIDPTHLQAALESLWAQTHMADEVVIVEDGPLPDALTEVLDDASKQHPEMRRIRLAVNSGAGPAAAAGMRTISSTLTARLDADDIAVPERFEKQLEIFEAADAAGKPLDVLGTAVAEFDDAEVVGGKTPEEAIVAVRSLPERHEAIKKYMRINSPINNPSSMLRTESVLSAGNYRNVPMMEDYELWARMLACGYRFENLPEPLTMFRTSEAVFDRRTGRDLWRSELQMQRYLLRYQIVNKPRAAFNFVARMGYRILPRGAVKSLYRRLFHKNSTN